MKGSAKVAVEDESTMLANLKAPLRAFNGLELTAEEFTKVLFSFKQKLPGLFKSQNPAEPVESAPRTTDRRFARWVRSGQTLWVIHWATFTLDTLANRLCHSSEVRAIELGKKGAKGKRESKSECPPPAPFVMCWGGPE